MSNDIQRIIEFILELDKLKAVLRKTKPLGMDRYENSAEHCWQVCLLALLLAKHARHPVDVIRVIEILLVAFLPSLAGYKDALAFLILIAILLFRPTGILGEKLPE